MLLVSTGVTILGATTYLIAKRYKISISKRKDDVSDDELDYEDDYMQDVYDEIQGLRDRNNKGKKSQRESRRKNQVPPPMITFKELLERAQELSMQKLAQRKVKIYFDSNDEYVMEDAIPEIKVRD